VRSKGATATRTIIVDTNNYERQEAALAGNRCHSSERRGKVSAAALRLSGNMNSNNLLVMQNINSSIINATAVALLAIAVILLAIKEPRCACENNPQKVEASSVQPPSPSRATGSRRQRELRKF